MTGTSVPALETERLVLRGHVLEDFPAYAAMWADPHVTKFIGGKPLSEEEAWGKFLRNFGQWMVMGFGFWSVVERLSGERVGEVGFVEGRRDIVPSLIGMPRLRHGSCTRRTRLGRNAFRHSAHGLHYCSGKHRFPACGGEVRIPHRASHNV
jgi:hypothetical protein